MDIRPDREARSRRAAAVDPCLDAAGAPRTERVPTGAPAGSGRYAAAKHAGAASRADARSGSGSGSSSSGISGRAWGLRPRPRSRAGAGARGNTHEPGEPRTPRTPRPSCCVAAASACNMARSQLTLTAGTTCLLDLCTRNARSLAKHDGPLLSCSPGGPPVDGPVHPSCVHAIRSSPTSGCDAALWLSDGGLWRSGVGGFR